MFFVITVLSVKLPEAKGRLDKLTRRLRRDKLDISIREARGVCLKHITYTGYNGKICLERADKIIGAQRAQLVCSDKLVFPENCGYKRFCSREFSVRLCTNMALSVLSACGCAAKIKLGIYDINGDSCDFLYHALEYCSDVTIFTKNIGAYRCVADRALDELGAASVITTNPGELSGCDFAVAVQPVEHELGLSANTIVLTVAEPRAKIGGRVYYRYHFRMPNGFDAIKPPDLDEEYFCSALYTLGGQYQLGSIVPLVCRGFQSSQTVKSLCESLRNQCEN